MIDASARCSAEPYVQGSNLATDCKKDCRSSCGSDKILASGNSIVRSGGNVFFDVVVCTESDTVCDEFDRILKVMILRLHKQSHDIMIPIVDSDMRGDRSWRLLHDVDDDIRV